MNRLLIVPTLTAKFGLSPDAPADIHNNLNLGRVAQVREIMQAVAFITPRDALEFGSVFTPLNGQNPPLIYSS